MNRISLLAAILVALLATPARGVEAGSPPEPPPEAAAPAVAPPTAAEVAAEVGDAPEVEEEIVAESAEIDAVRLAEEKAGLVPLPHPEDGAAREAVRLGTESPIRQGIAGALDRDPAPMPEEDAGSIALLPEIGHDLRRLQAEYDIPIDINEAVVQYVRFFQSPGVRKHFVKWLGRLPRYQARYRTILREAGLPEDTIYLAMIESGFANLAYSRAKAAGPWQFISSTGKRMGLAQDFWVDERRDPEKSARAAATYLKLLYAEFGDWRLAWAGYNAGEGKIEKAKRKGQLDFWTMARGKILKRETKGYVPKLMAAAIISKHAAAFGFRPEEIEAERWVEYERVTIPHAVELETVAKAAGVSTHELHELNPELRRNCTPPRAYAVKLPAGRADAFAQAWPEVGPAAGLHFTHHVVVKGEGIGAIASAYGVSSATVLQMNGLKAGKRLKPGTELVIPLGQLARRAGSPAAEVVARAPAAKPAQKPARPAARPAASTAPVASGADTKVQVQAGDSLWGIARRLGVKLQDLCDWNGIANPKSHKLVVGSELVVRPPSARPATITTAG